MVVVALGAHVEEQRRLAMHPERGRGDHGALDAVRAPRAQDLTHRTAVLPVELEVLSQVVDVRLDLLRCVEPAQHCEFPGSEAEVRRTGEALAHGSEKI